MTIDTRSIVSITEANQNFSRVARLVDELGSAVIMKNNSPKYILMDFGQMEKRGYALDELIDKLSEQYIKRNQGLYETLAK